MASPRLAVLGAGSIGCYVGGVWKAAGLDVTFVGRAGLAGDIAAAGLKLSDYSGWNQRFEPGEMAYHTDPAILRDADVILVAVKSGGTETAAKEIDRFARDGTVVVSLQNGIGNVEVLKRALGGRMPVVWAMIPYNVVYLGDGRFHKGVGGRLIAQDCAEIGPLVEAVANSREPLTLAPDMAAIAWGKLLINLNNAVNALSGLSLVDQLGQRDFRRVVAASQAEALAILKSAKIRPAKVGPVPPRLLPHVIAAPDWLFHNIFARGWKIDAKARSSMADDLERGRRTEIDALNGEVVRIAEVNGRDAPVNRRIVELIRAAEEGAKPWNAATLRREVLGRG
jgi:2-dehydropantoate 2-reductase